MVWGEQAMTKLLMELGLWGRRMVSTSLGTWLKTDRCLTPASLVTTGLSWFFPTPSTPIMSNRPLSWNCVSIESSTDSPKRSALVSECSRSTRTSCATSTCPLTLKPLCDCLWIFALCTCQIDVGQQNAVVEFRDEKPLENWDRSIQAVDCSTWGRCAR